MDRKPRKAKVIPKEYHVSYDKEALADIPCACDHLCNHKGTLFTSQKRQKKKPLGRELILEVPTGILSLDKNGVYVLASALHEGWKFLDAQKPRRTPAGDNP